MPIRQITTGTVCHLEAAMVENALEGWDLDELDFLFVENVGNLVCPATYDLGETLRLVLLSVTEGEDKPLKYPPIFNSADVAIITKIDLAAAVEFDRAAAHRSIQSVRPGMQIFETLGKNRPGHGRVAFVPRVTPPPIPTRPGCKRSPSGYPRPLDTSGDRTNVAFRSAKVRPNLPAKTCQKKSGDRTNVAFRSAKVRPNLFVKRCQKKMERSPPMLHS